MNCKKTTPLLFQRPSRSTSTISLNFKIVFTSRNPRSFCCTFQLYFFNSNDSLFTTYTSRKLFTLKNVCFHCKAAKRLLAGREKKIPAFVSDKTHCFPGLNYQLKALNFLSGQHCLQLNLAHSKTQEARQQSSS